MDTQKKTYKQRKQVNQNNTQKHKNIKQNRNKKT